MTVIIEKKETKLDHILGILSRIDGQNVALNNSNSTTSGRIDKVRVHFEHGTLSNQPLGERLLGQLLGGLDLLVPVARVTWYVVLVA